MRVAVAVMSGVALIAAAGCGGHPNNGTAKRDINPADQRRAKAMLLKLSDFPAGWQASAGPSAKDKASGRAFRNCLGVNLSNITLTGDIEKDFKMGGSTQVTSKASIAASPSQAKDGLRQVAAGMASNKLRDCITKMIGKAPGGYRVGNVTVGQLHTPAPPEVDETRAWQIVLPVEGTSGASKGVSVPAYLDFVFLLRGDSIAEVATLDAYAPVDSGLRDKLVQTVARRMAGSS